MRPAEDPRGDGDLGGIAGLGGASQIGDFSHVLDAGPRACRARVRLRGIVVAALGR